MTIAGQNISIAGAIAFVMALCAAVPGLAGLIIDAISNKPIDSTTITAVVVGVAAFIAAWLTHENTSSSTGGQPAASPAPPKP